LIARAAATVLDSPGFVGAVAAIVGAGTGWFTRQATIRSAEISARPEEGQLSLGRAQFAAERRDLATDDFIRAGEFMAKLALSDARLDIRMGQAAEARRSLLRVELILGERIAQPGFDELLEDLRAPTEASLNRSADAWPRVEQQIRRHFHHQANPSG
jgi:hypothetical protein